MHTRLSVVLTVTLCPVLGWTAGAWHASRSDHVRPVHAAASKATLQESPASGRSALPAPLPEEPLSDDRLDFYGNDVSPAIARYRRDQTGAVREEHSPSTDVIRLTPATT